LSLSDAITWQKKTNYAQSVPSEYLTQDFKLFQNMIDLRYEQFTTENVSLTLSSMSCEYPTPGQERTESHQEKYLLVVYRTKS
jgi:hypothetical protein